MNVDKVVQYWTESAAEDWPVTKHLLDSGAYQYALFFGHLYLEKLLKAMVVSRTGRHAPRTHNLLFLAERAGLAVSPQQHEVLLRVTAIILIRAIRTTSRPLSGATHGHIQRKSYVSSRKLAYG